MIPLLMGLFHFVYVLNMTMQQNVYTNTLILKHSKELLEGSLNSISTYSKTLNQLKVLDDIVSTTNRKDMSLLDLQNAAREFPLLRDESRYVEANFLYSNRNEIILAPGKVFLNAGIYDGASFDFDGMPFSQWSQALLNEKDSHNGIFLFPLENGEGRLLYKTPYVSRKDGRLIGQQLFLLDQQKIHDALYPAFHMGAGFMYIEDQDGNRLVTMEQDGWTASSIEMLKDSGEGSMELKINGDKMVVTYCKSAEYGWTYVIAVPKSTLISISMSSLKMALVAMVVLALIGIFTILGAYKYNKKPLMNMVRYMPPNTGMEDTSLRRRIQNGLWQVSGSITSLASDNSRMEEQLSQQRKALHQSFFVQLVTGQLLDESILPEFLRSYGLDEDCSSLRGVYLKILSRDAAATIQAKPIIEAAISIKDERAELIPCFWMDNSHLALLYAEKGQVPADFYMDFLRDIHFQLMEEWELETSFSLGAEYSSFGEVHLSFAEARKLLSGDEEAAPILRAIQPDPGHQEKFFYGFREEDALLEMAGAGRFEEVKGLLSKIRRVNFNERHLNTDMREMLFYRMVSTLMCAGWGAELPLNKISLSSLDTEEFFTLLIKQYEIACKQNACRLQEDQQRMQNEIIQYIDDHFQNRDMGLSMLSQKFSVTESYLSTLIKNLLGENFSGYLESKRINAANHLLLQGEKSVTEIGLCVGYDSATSFGRAYKRVMGHSPSQYLKYQNARICEEKSG